MADKISAQNDLFDAIYAIASGVVDSKSYDITKECKIVEVYTDDKGSRTGVYKVKCQNATYDAYAKKGEIYYVDDYVYVQIPNGDYNQQKFILGKKSNSDGTTEYNFQLPLDNFLGLYNLGSLSDSFGYWANDPAHGSGDTDLIWHREIADSDNIYATHMGIEANFTTLLHGYSPSSGHYGLRIVVIGSTETELEKRAEYYFTDSNMYGNPYAYTDGSTQQILIDIQDFLQIKDISIYFWQDHNFKDQLGEAIPYGETNYDAIEYAYKRDKESIESDSTLTDEEKKSKLAALLQWYSDEINKASILKNIIINSANIYMGITSEDKEEQLVLYTYDQVSYGADPDHEEVRKADRELRLAWIHEVTGGVQMVSTAEKLEEYDAKIYWYQYDESWTAETAEYDETILAHKFGGLYWRPIDIEGGLLKTVSPDLNKSKDRYKAIVHYNNSYTVSNVLIFTNYHDVEAEKSDLAKNDKVILRCALLGEDSDGVTRLIDDDAIGDFYVYDENNNVLANDDNVLFSNVRYYIEPWIKVSTDTDNTHDGYQRLAEYTDADGNKPEFTVTWQWPENFTMISSFGELDETVKEESDFYNNCSTAQFELYKKATRWFYIKSDYNMRYSDNGIIAEIEIEGYGTCTARKTLQFGRAEAFGSEYVPVITISSPEGNYYVDTASDFEVYCLVYDRSGNLLGEEDRANCKFAWKFLGTNPPSDNREHENYKNFQGNLIRGRITEAEPFIIQVTVSGAAAYDLTIRRGVMVCNNAEYMQTHDIQCPDRVEFKSDGQQPLYYSAAFEVQEINTKEQNTLIYPEWKINSTSVLQLIHKEKDYPTFTLPTGVQSTKDSVMQYALGFSKQYLNGTIAKPSVYGQQWTDELLEDQYFTYIYFEDGDVKVAQAIAFDRNLYSSSLVNEWNGQSLSLDEENSAVLGKMISAGTKDSKNRFTGVMMGDWHEKGDESLETPGLYGFSKGEQTFGFTTEGTGFIGASGYGRIEFDGENALISNPTKTCYINLNPRVFRYTDNGDLDNQVWNGIGEQGFSQYFLYCELPQPQTVFTSDTDGLWWIENSWAKSFLTDFKNGKDYFIVDPNNGVLTTGGIFARFGQIGINTPWIIHDNGLTQKNNFGTIFLGSADKNPSIGDANAIVPSLVLSSGALADDNFYAISSSNTSNIIQTGIRPDGFLYTKLANIGGWCINDKEIYAPSNDVFRSNYKGNETGYANDNLNFSSVSTRQGISFRRGKMIISGTNGWMGSYSNGLNFDSTSPAAYDMLLDFNKGIMKFGKSEGALPYTAINGKNGSAYFAQGNIYIDGEQALIYCGVPQEISVDDGAIEATTSGAVNLGGMQVLGKSNVSISYTYGLSETASDSGSFEIKEFIDAEEMEDATVQLSDSTYQYYVASTKLTPDGNSEKTFNATSSLLLSTNITSEINEYGSGAELLICDGSQVVFKPTNNSTGYLGNWYIDALSISSSGNIFAKGSITAKGTAYMSDEVTGVGQPGTIATRVWVQKYISDNIIPNITTTNNSAASAMSKANSAAKAAKKAADAATEALASTVTGISYFYENGSLKMGVGYRDSSYKEGGSVLTFEDFTADSQTDGTVKLTLKIANLEKTVNFKIADTGAYKNLVSALKFEKSDDGSLILYAKAVDNAGNSVKGINSVSGLLSLKGEGKTITAEFGNSDVKISDSITLALSGEYGKAKVTAGDASYALSDYYASIFKMIGAKCTSNVGNGNTSGEADSGYFTCTVPSGSSADAYFDRQFTLTDGCSTGYVGATVSYAGVTYARYAKKVEYDNWNLKVGDTILYNLSDFKITSLQCSSAGTYHYDLSSHTSRNSAYAVKYNYVAKSKYSTKNVSLGINLWLDGTTVYLTLAQQ